LYCHIVDILTVMFLLPAIYKCNDNNSFFVHAFTVQALMLWVANEQTQTLYLPF
jgi:hypothetical protein